MESVLLGPKMYNVFGSLQDNTHRGSTRLHMDITDALNVLHWAAPINDGLGYAVWHIFPAESAPLLRKFITEISGFDGPGDPIHSHEFYLTPELLDQLWTEYSVKPYIIHQFAGQVVFIPAGCPHQVSVKSAPFVRPLKLTHN